MLFQTFTFGKSDLPMGSFLINIGQLIAPPVLFFCEPVWLELVAVKRVYHPMHCRLPVVMLQTAFGVRITKVTLNSVITAGVIR